MSTASPTLKDVSDRLANDPSRDDLIGAIETLANEAQRAREERDRLREKNERLRDELAEERERSARERADVRSDVHELTETVQSHEDGETEASTTVSSPSNPEGQAAETAVPEAETSLGQAIRLPEHVAKENLTENQRRARSVAKDVHQYATSVPAGYRLSASELRRVLSAQEDGATIHGQTLSRVRDFLLRLGGDHVELKESRGGTTSVIFDEDFVKRVVAWANHSDGHTAVTRGGVSG